MLSDISMALLSAGSPSNTGRVVVWLVFAVNLACLAFFASVFLTRLTREWAKKINFVDHPDGHRKVHRKPVALGGGLAVFLAATLTLAIAAVFPGSWQADFIRQRMWMLGLLAACAWLCAVGLLDDRYRIRGRHKLAAQFVAALIVSLTGPTIDQIAFFGHQLPPLGWMAYPFTLFWLIGAVNSLNLIDGIDGLAGSVGVIFGVTFGVISLANYHVAAAAVSFAIAGSLLGFLRFNFPPASIYLGDAGSMVIGLAFGAIAIHSSIKGVASVAMVGPLAVWAIPILDSVAAIMRRKLTGRSIYATDRGHLHHLLLHRGFSNRQTLGWIVLLCAGTAGGALAAVFLDNEFIAIVNVVAVVGILLATRVFGHVELSLLKSHLHRWVSHSRPAEKAIESSVRLQGSREWKTIWSALTESAERFELSYIKLNLHLPQMHEGFYASWKRKIQGEPDHYWRAELPIALQGRVIGRLEVAGMPDSHPASIHVGAFLDFVEPFEAGLASLLLAQNDPPEPQLTAAPDTANGPLATAPLTVANLQSVAAAEPPASVLLFSAKH